MDRGSREGWNRNQNSEAKEVKMCAESRKRKQKATLRRQGRNPQIEGSVEHIDIRNRQKSHLRQSDRTLLSDNNIEMALKQVVANKGPPPGVDMAEPVCAKVYSGNMNDKSVFRDFLESNGIISGLVLTDKGFSYENAKVFLDNPALHFLIP